MNTGPIAIVPSKEMGDMIHVSWMLHNKCNKRCSYCREFNWNGRFDWLKLEDVKTFVDKIVTHFQKKTYHFSFHGGEPTLWPHFAELCHYLHNKKCVIGLTTNGTLSPEFWQGIAHTINWICISYHPEYDSEENIIKVLKVLSPYTRLAVRVMMHKEEKYWEKSVQFAERLKSIKDCSSLYVEYVPLMENFAVNSRPLVYHDWQNEFFKNNNNFVVKPTLAEPANYGPDVWDYKVVESDYTTKICRSNELVANNQVNFSKWTCYAGIDQLFVNERGEIFRGTCMQGGMIGSILDKDLELPLDPIVCRTNFCPCGTDILVKKFHPDFQEEKVEA